MFQAQIPPTRQELLKLKDKLKSASRGFKLLKDKRDSLIKEFIQSYQKAVRLRKDMDQDYFTVLDRFGLSQDAINSDYLQVLVDSPERKLWLENETKNIMGVRIQELTLTEEGEMANYSFFETDYQLDYAINKLDQMVPTVIQLVQEEYKVRKLAEEIEKTRKRVNALEYVILPEYKRRIKLINSKLAELALQNTVRLMRIKKQITVSE